MAKLLKIGTRSSPLALWQAEWVSDRIRERYPDIEVTLVKIKTTGDKILDVPLAQVGGKGLFVKEIEEAMLCGDVDIAVHSMKDVPTVFPPGLGLTCITKREDPRDALISRGLSFPLSCRTVRGSEPALSVASGPASGAATRSGNGGDSRECPDPPAKLEDEGLDAVSLRQPA
ncbi:MAG: hypothetical protein AB9919_03260 [Geobacteraceae bacterium]